MTTNGATVKASGETRTENTDRVNTSDERVNETNEKHYVGALIVKLQLSIMTSSAQPNVLIYDEPRTVRFEVPLTPKLVMFFDGGETTVYLNAYQDREMDLHLLDRAPDQPW